MKFGLLVLATIFLVPLGAQAHKVVVLQGRYEVVWEKTDSAARSQMIADRVISALGEEGLETVALDTVCAERKCLDEAVGRHEESVGVFVSVKQEGMRYELNLFWSDGRSAATELTGAFSAVLDEVPTLIRKTLKKEVVEEVAVVEPDRPKPEEPIEETGREKKLKPAVFWTSLGITGALAVGYGITEIVGLSKKNALSDTPAADRKQSDWDSFKKVQTTDRVLFAATMTGIVVTTTLFFFTNFNEKDAETKTSLVPAFGPDGGFLTLHGEF